MAGAGLVGYEDETPSCLVVQHIEPERPYAIADALARAGAQVDLRLIARGDHLPTTLDGYGALIVMGGPMSATSDEGFPTRSQELSLLEKALESGTPTLGVCLGAQLLAAAAGAKVYTGSAGPEIGWGNVSLTPEATVDTLFAGLPRELTVLHWHGETFDLPSHSAHLAISPMYPNQAFRVGASAWGLQFHIEVNALAVGTFVRAFAEEAEAVGVIPSVIAAQCSERLDRLGPVQRTVLDRFAAIA